MSIRSRSPRLPWAFVLAVAVTLAFFVVLVTARGLVDADYFWHVTTGELIVTQGLPRVDPFSFTWQGQPWVLHEWLGQVLVYALVSAIGAVGVSAVFGFVIGLAPVLVGAALVRRGAPTAVVIGLLALGTYVLAPFATVRPQALSWLLMAVLLAGLVVLDARRRMWAWLIVPLFLLWANLHGLYVVGLGVLGLYWLFTVAGLTSLSGSRLLVTGVVAASFLASAVTPAGLEGLTYPLRYVDGGDWGLANIQEWQSPDFHDPRHWGLLILIGALVLGAGSPLSWLTVLGWLGMVLALFATRNAPLAALLAMPAVAIGMRGWSPRAWPIPAPSVGRHLLETGLAAVVIVSIVIIVPPAVGGARSLDDVLPVAAFDELASVDPDARVLVEYGWGGYAISRLYPAGGRVFVDGRNDMYSDEILDDYSLLRSAADGWEILLGRYGVEAIVLPPSAPLVDAAEGAGWCRAHADALSVLLLHSCPQAITAHPS